MLSQFQPSCRLNVHPSLLPAYRGPAPIQHSIMNDEKETGVCVIQMLKKKEGIDAGQIWGCRKMVGTFIEPWCRCLQSIAYTGERYLPYATG